MSRLQQAELSAKQKSYSSANNDNSTPLFSNYA